MRSFIRWAVACAILALTYAAPARAQNTAELGKQQFYVFVDTAGVAAVAPDVYTTWVYARATPRSWPSSAILVAFDCKARKVARLAHVVYKMNADSTGVNGPIVEDKGDWVDVSVPETFRVVCEAGARHPWQPIAPYHPRSDIQGEQPPFGKPYPQASAAS